MPELHFTDGVRDGLMLIGFAGISRRPPTRGREMAALPQA
jgi:hypothetical protein